MSLDGGRRKEDVRNVIEDALSDEQDHIPVGLPLPCRAVHLKRLDYELNDPKDAHCCTVRDL